ncbi:MAG TPA: hypothetical protein VGP94_15240 [Tepidisphaeraceae bacterium]|nr:hypothetical protein [Tepidisphaeraceae bacterium]
MPTTVLEPPPEALPQQPIQYARATAPVTRRQFRFLLFLTLLNTILLAAFVCGPTLSQYTRSTWQQYQTRQKIRQQQKAQDALLQQAAQYTAPPDQIVYEENPLDAAALLNPSGSSTMPSGSSYIPINRSRLPWQPPVALADPPIVTQLRAVLPGRSGVYATLLLHTLKKKNSQQRLVWVIVQGEQQNMGVKDYFAPGDLNRTLKQLSFKTRRMISAMIVESDNQQPMPTLHTSTQNLVPEMLDMESTVTWKDASTDSMPTIEPKGVLRFYAAQIDPNNPSHFTIDYVYRGDRNTIDVNLEDDDSFVFSPRAGMMARDQGQTQIWYPFTRPNTRPSSP